MFHEFGHALHGMFAAQTYPTLSGTSVARDFVEFPSQFNENWALDPKILPHYAVHYQTGQTIPPALVQKILAARTFNQGYEVGEALEAARLDLDWHSLPATAPRQDVDKFEADALAKSGFDTADVPPRYRSSYFLHIWSNGYSASYYAYAWTRMLGQDAFNWFETHGGLTRANGQRFRDMVLSRGNTLDYAEMYRGWAGHDAADPALSRLLRAERRYCASRLTARSPAPRNCAGGSGDPRGDCNAMIRQLDDHLMVSGQIAPHEVAGLAEQGSDGAGQQPARRRGAGPAACRRHREPRRQAGIAYHFVPIMRGIGPADVESMQKALRDAEVASCSPSAARARAPPDALALAQARGRRARAEEIDSALTDAGFDSGPIAHLL